ncbi:MAG: glycerophosphodiester phosphodiesterase [Acidobacteria bacterium]|nr:glycerophosphodiester phosphodiesterase [Acidobacteriota bacterium]
MAILRIGHRGAAGHAPENTVLSIRKAIALGADMVELDVRGTRDGRCVLLHDERVDRTTNGRGAVAEMTLEEVRRLDAGQGERIPTLEEALDAASGCGGVMLEIKPRNLAETVAGIVRQSRFAGRVLYASFLHSELTALRSLVPAAETMALLEADSALEPRELKGLGFAVAGLPLGPRLPPSVGAFHAAGFAVFVYTVNDPSDIAWVKSLAVEGIISDYPERI